MNKKKCTIYTGMGKSNDWEKLGLTKEEQENLDQIGHVGYFEIHKTFESYLNHIRPQNVYSVSKIGENGAEFSAKYEVTVFEKSKLTAEKKNIVGLAKDNNTKFIQMKAAYNACKNAGVEVPHEIKVYFHDKEPEENNLIEINIDKYINIGVNGIEINVKELDGVELIRIVSTQ